MGRRLRGSRFLVPRSRANRDRARATCSSGRVLRPPYVHVHQAGHYPWSQDWPRDRRDASLPRLQLLRTACHLRLGGVAPADCLSFAQPFSNV